MIWPFKPKAFLEPQDEAWHFETWAWLLARWGGLDDLRRSPLVAPTREFFPPSEATGHARAEVVFDRIKALAQMQGWSCRLEAQPTRPEAKVSDYVVMRPDRANPLGTFGWDGQEILITYDPALLDDPLALVATLAHELAHYRLANVLGKPPGGREMEEYATDLATIYLGFGLFGANCAFRFEQHQDFMSQGWKWSRQGYLGEHDWVFSLAIFLALRGETTDAVTGHLKPELMSELRKAARYLDGHAERLAELRATASGASDENEASDEAQSA